MDIKIKDLNIREYECQKCHNELNIDINARINIMFEGLKEYIANCEVRCGKISF